MEDCKLEGNNATGFGGGIVVRGNATAKVTRTSMVHNLAIRGGGGIAVVSYTKLHLASTDISMSLAEKGAAIWVADSSTVFIAGGILSHNFASVSYAGGVFIGGES